jgi:serine/threonine protein kinase
MALQAGEMLGPYRIEGQMGSGGMATVYRAYHAKLDRNVAIKMMHESLLQDVTFKQRFEREARIVASLEHPNIVPIYDFSENDGHPYLVMKFVEGQTLKALLRERALTLDEIRRLFRTIADALGYAHERGVLHRDIKPSNIIIDERGIPYLTDFGLARLVISGESTMSADMLLGTPYYISPEQAAGAQQVDARADVYSLGIVLYELMVGRVPFQADTPYATIHDHIYTPPPPPRELNPEITPAVEAVLLKALAKRPEERYPNAEALVRAFEAALASDHVDHLDPERQTQAEQRGASSAPARGEVVVPSPRSEQKPKTPQPPSPPAVGEPFEQIGRQFEEMGKSIEQSFSGAIPSRMNWKPGTQWRINGPEGMGFYTEEELEAAENAQPDEQRVRKFIEKRNEERIGLIIHFAVFAFMNLMFLTGFWRDGGDLIAQFPGPLIITFFWGIGMFSHFASYYNKFGGGRERHEAMIQREIERERARRYGEKVKNDELFYEDEDPAQRIRLNEDGELTDSYIEEWDAEQKRKRR